MDAKSTLITKISLGVLAVVACLAVVMLAAEYVLKTAVEQKHQEVALEIYARLPEVPVRVTYRKALVGPSLVAIFDNTSDRSLSLLATFTNPTMHTEHSFRLDIAAHGHKEVGHLEGWAFASGDLIKVTHADYKPLSIKLP
jgi:hypothetical protein